MTIKIFVTGGTFDKEYDKIKGILFFNKTHLSEILKMGRCKIKLDIKTLMMKDSLEMTNEDRKTILENCKKTKEGKVLITHGTDTMVET
ncbi:MAG: asparaginase domain-containing protein, partial [Petrotogales bacterium]